MKIENDIKLDFIDVLIRPKRSTLSTRSEVDVTKTVKFVNSKQTWEGVPIITSNMDTIGTFEMYNVLKNYKMITCLSKHYEINDFPEDLDREYYMLSTGINDQEWRKLQSLISHLNPKFVCVDVANGYMSKLIEFVKKLREAYPNLVIACGNVVSREMVEELIINGGADIIKCGIGSGCFSSDTKILLGNGTYKNISDIEIGDMVINKNGDPVKVINKFNKGIRNLYKIKTNNWHDDTYVTPDHKYWIGDLSSSSERSFSGNGKAKLLDKLAKTTPKSSKYKWKSLDQITKKDLLLLPNNIKWKLDSNFRIDLSEFCNRGEIKDNKIITKTSKNNDFNRYLRSTYDLGYIFGTFLGDGNSHITNFKKSERGSCHWSFGLHEIDIAKKLQECIEKELDYESSISEKDGKVLSVNCYNKCLSKLLSQFSKRTEKHLPEKYYCSNIEYIQGLYDGLIDSDGSTEKCKDNKVINVLTNTSKQILELFYWCCMNLKISYSVCKNHKSIGNLKGTCIENLKDSFRIKTHTFNRFTKDYVYSEMFDCDKTEPQVTWDIEVDCPTHSFIANNSIVHNSVCTTRLQTGVGMPQLSAVMECSDAAHGINGAIISDGGITCPGDVSKALGAGADFVMLGSMLSGHEECAGELQEIDGQKYKLFYGMSSSTAMNKYSGGVAKYRSSEGKTVKIKYKGPVSETIDDILGGVRSTCTYIGASRIKDVPKCTTFMMVNRQVNTIHNGKEV